MDRNNDVKHLAPVAVEEWTTGCPAHRFEQSTTQNERVGRYRMQCIHCNASVVLWVDGYGAIRGVRSPKVNAHWQANPREAFDVQRGWWIDENGRVRTDDTEGVAAAH